MPVIKNYSCLPLEFVTLVCELLTAGDVRPNVGALVVARELFDVVVLLSYWESLAAVLFNL